MNDTMNASYASFASMHLVRKVMIEIAAYCLLVLIVLWKGGWMFALCMIVYMLIPASVITGIVNVNAFRRFVITERGLSNRFLTFSWDEIHEYGLCRTFEVRVRNIRFRRRDLPSLVCFGACRKGDFRDQSPQSSIFFEMTPKNMRALARFAKGKSDVVDDFLANYYDVVCEK